MRLLKILVYTDNAIFARGLRALLEPALSVDVATPSGSELAAAIHTAQPDILLLDEMRGDVNAVAKTHALFPHVQIIAWINTDAAELSLQMMEAGAVALLQNSCSEQDVKDAIAAITRGEVFVPSSLSQTMWMSRRCKITPRESQLMLRVSQGLANKEIAWQLGISEGTVKVYLSRLFAKLGVSDRYELALLGLRNGAMGPSGIAQDNAGRTVRQEMAPRAVYLKRSGPLGEPALQSMR